jgi:hypothetical protein
MTGSQPANLKTPEYRRLADEARVAMLRAREIARKYSSA